MNYTFTSESVAPGHPDKIADQISDAILDEYLREEPTSRTAIETMVTENNVIIGGEVYGPSSVSKKIEDIVRHIIKSVGYITENFHWEKIEITNLLHQQSHEIASGVAANRGGAGDQGMMFGYATDETTDFIPASIFYAHQVLKNIFATLKSDERLGPDAKSQVTLLYRDGKPVAVANIIVSIQHPPSMPQTQVRDAIYDIVKNTFPNGWMCSHENFLVNPSGKFTIGGPISDCGLTGRKIIVDTYGGAAPHGGGAFSGKDASKVDRSAAYMARYVAKNIVAAGLAKRCLVSLAYAIGVAEPIAINLNTYNTHQIAEQDILYYIKSNVDFSPTGIKKLLRLDHPIYLPTATYGHFGRKSEADFFLWEKCDLDLSSLMKKAI